MVRLLTSVIQNKKTWFMFSLGLTIVVMISLSLYALVKYIVIQDAENDLNNLLLHKQALHHYLQRDAHPVLYAHKQTGEIKDDFYAPELLSSTYMTRVIHSYLNDLRNEKGLSEIYYKMAAVNPRNPVNQADRFEEKLIQRFNQDRSLTSFRQILDVDGKEYLYYALPFLETTDACLKCHGNRADSPLQLQARYPGQGGFHDLVGNIRAIESIRVPMAPKLTSVHIFFVSFLCAGIAIFLVILATRRLKEIVRLRTQELAESEGRFRRLAENAKDLIFRMSLPDGRLEYVSPASTAMLGYSPEEMYEKSLFFHTILAKDWFSRFTGMWDRLVRGEAQDNYEYPVVDKSGKSRWLNQRNVLVRDEAGNPIALEGIIRDVTAQKNLEAQLLQSQKMEAIGKLAGGVAHDFNNVLTAINGYSEMALESLSPADALHDDLVEIRKAGERATALTRQLLAFSRKQIFQPRVFDLNELIQNMSKMLRRLIGEDVVLTTILDDTACVIKTDPGQIEQVIMNLAVNGREAMHSGGQLIIETKKIWLNASTFLEKIDLQAGEYILLAVSDSGCGIDTETQEHIFEPFFTTKEISKGTGLGLSTVYGIVSQSAGHITVYSEIGKGTTFKIYLPSCGETFHECDDVDVMIDDTPASGTILLVEDEDMVRSFLSRVLREKGYRVYEAVNGRHALELCDTLPEDIDVLLTDIVMPEMNGTELARKLLEKHPSIRCIYMSGYTDNTLFLHDVLEKNLLFLPKPLQVSTLLETLRTVMNE